MRPPFDVSPHRAGGPIAGGSSGTGSASSASRTSGVSTTQRGRLAESLAAAYLELCGFTILERNHREGPREIDLIARKDGWLIVVEVRFRRGCERGLPEESLHFAKRGHLQRAALSYWIRSRREGEVESSGDQRNGPHDQPPGKPARERLRLDLVTLLLEEDGLRLRHYPHFLLPAGGPVRRRR